VNRPPQNAPANWGAVPFVPVALALGAGILTADVMGFSPPDYWLLPLMVIGALGLLSLFWRRPERWFSVGVSGLILAAVFIFGGWRVNATYLPAHPAFFAHHQTKGNLLSGRVLVVKPGEKTLRAEVRLHHLLADGNTAHPVRGQVYVYLPPDEKAARLKAGDGIVLRGTPNLLEPPLNPGVFDLRAYRNRKGFYHQLFPRSDADWKISSTATVGLRARAEGWRRAWLRTFRGHLNGDRLAVAAALVLGQRDLISREVQSAYADTGAVHVLAVSGLHVGIIFMLLRLLLVKVLRLDRRRHGAYLIALVSILCIWAFAFTSGLSSSVQRAAIMFTVLALGNIGYLKTHVFNALAIAAIGMLTVEPAQLFQVSFQLSYTAIIGIVAFTNHVNRLFYFTNGLLRAGWSAIAASTGAQLGTLPLSLLYFKQFPAYFLLSGTLVIVFAFATMFAGILHGFVAGVLGFSAGAAVTGWLLSTIVTWQNALIFFFQKLPGALIFFPNFDGGMSLLLAAAIVTLALYLRWRRRPALITGGVFLVILLIWAGTRVQRKVEGVAATLFHVRKATLLDVVTADGRAWSFGEQPTEKNLAWSAGPLRKQIGYDPAATFPFSPTADTVLMPDVRLAYPHLYLGDTHWLILDGERKHPDLGDLAGVTHLLPINDFRPDDLPAFPSGDPPQLLLDGGTPFYRWDDWRAAAEAAGLHLYVTGEAGAYQLR